MRDEILALLEDEPATHIELAKILGQPRELVRQELRALFQAGLVQRRELLWTLAGRPMPAPSPRQPLKPAAPVPPPSFWVTAPRDAFTARCQAEHGRMLQSKFSRVSASGGVNAGLV